MSGGVFPERPRGDAGGIHASASTLVSAARELADGGSNLRWTASGLRSGEWSGQAADRFASASAGIAQAYHGAAETLTGCAGSLRTYAEALSQAQHVIDAARSEYEQAKAEQAAAEAALSGLGAQALAPHGPADLAGRLAAAREQASRAADRAQQALARARLAREEFDLAQSRTVSELQGEAPLGASGLLGNPFTAVGAGGLGALGGGFGVPAGGLSAYDGVARVEGLTGPERYAYLLYEDAKGVQETDDLSTAITLVIGGPGAKIGETLLTRIGAKLTEDTEEKLAARVAETEAGSIRDVNPGYPRAGRVNNCVNCAIATDARLAGGKAVALPGEAQPISKLEQMYGRKFEPVASPQALEQQLKEAGPGSRGIVFGQRRGAVGHVFNAVNQHGSVRFLDGQVGRSASFDGFDRLYFMRTDGGP